MRYRAELWSSCKCNVTAGPTKRSGFQPTTWRSRRCLRKLLLQPHEVPVRQEGDTIVRTLVGEGSPAELGTPGLILDVELARGGAFSIPVRSDFHGFVYVLEGEAGFGANRRRASRSQIAVLGPGDLLAVDDAQPGTRFTVMAGKPYGEAPVYNGSYVD